MARIVASSRIAAIAILIAEIARQRPCQVSFVKALLISIGILFWPSQSEAQEKFITLASTTSTEDSGLFKHLLPIFKLQTGITVRVVAQGTGQALETARRGDADALLVHDKAAEENFVAQGFGIARRDVMYNDFVIVGARNDPAKISADDSRQNASLALAKIAATGAPFVSRGDKSGTHAAELRLWQIAALNPQLGKGTWYREVGAGMGQTLNVANAMNAYTLADRSTWISFKNKDALSILVQGDALLRNQYGVIVVSPQRHPHVKTELAQAFADWITSPRGQSAIASYTIDNQAMFFPNSKM